MPTKLPIARVVLYHHGVASVERRGQVKGSDLIHLDVRAEALEDLLTSLVAIDLGGGQVSTISYEAANADGTRRLEVPPSGSLTHLLGQLQGARVRGKVNGQYVEGTVVGIDTAQVPAPTGSATVERQFLTVLHEGSLRTHDVLELKELTLMEEAVRKEVELALSTSLQGRRQDVRRLTLSAEGAGRRELFVSYAVKTAPWTANYRVLLTDAEAPLLQGWAEFVNPTDEDGEQVSVVLALPAPSGADPEQVEQQTAATDAAEDAAPAPSAPAETQTAPAAPDPVLDMFPDDALIGLGPSQSAPTSAVERASARARRVGELFEYQLGAPVALRRGQRAVVSILQEPCEATRALWFELPSSSGHPRACLELRNSTELVLAGGPIAVFEQGRFLGRGVLDPLAPDEGALVAYGEEPSCSIEVEQTVTGGELSSVAIAGSGLRARQSVERMRTLRAHNRGPRVQVLYVQHHREQGWEVADTSSKPEPTREGLWFRLELPAFGEQQLTVRERGTEERAVPLTDPSAQTIIDRLAGAQAPEVLELIDAHRRHETALTRLEQDHGDAAREHDRVRQSLAAVDGHVKGTGLHDTLLQRLRELEEGLTGLHRSREKARAERARVAEVLHAKLSGILKTRASS